MHGGYGDAWAGAVATSALLAAVLVIVAAGRVAYLAARVHRRGPAAATSHELAGSLDPGLLARIWLRTGVRLAAVGVVLLTVQENIERASTGAPAPPSSVTSPSSPSRSRRGESTR